VLRIFIALKNPSSWPGFEPAIFGSSGQHTKHYTIKATYKTLTSLMMMVYLKPLSTARVILHPVRGLSTNNELKRCGTERS
jgi:hypothetical protein